ncbi:MAG: cation diffusion facilitator family transporter [Bdellovibrionota bacterium]
MNTPPVTSEGNEEINESLVRFASYVSIVVGVVLLVMKFWAFRITQSQAVFSDAMESIVNVVAAGLAVLVVWIARKPADRDHPYGHGKIEFFSAAFEGGLIAFASILICAEAVQALLRGHSLRAPLVGLVVTIGAGLANAMLGLFLVRVGKRHKSISLEASGKHVLTDFWTSVGVAAGLILVPMTGLQWIDPVVALLMGLLLVRTGFGLVRRSVGGLLDEEDREILGHLLKIIGRERPSGIIQVHHVRVIRSGHFHHIDAHAVVPEFWDVSEAHEKTEQFEYRLIADYPYPGELHLHVDPCRRAYCRNCDVADCPIRQHAFEHVRQLSIEELTNPEEPAPFRAPKSNAL